MEFYISPQSGQFYMINVLENQWLSVTITVLKTIDNIEFVIHFKNMFCMCIWIYNNINAFADIYIKALCT